MLDGRVLGASQVEYKPFGKPPLKREQPLMWQNKDFGDAIIANGLQLR